MGIYADLSDDDLNAEIISLRTKIRTAAGNPAIRSVAGEGRRVEYAGNVAVNLRELLREAEAELRQRTSSCSGGAIGIRF